MSRPLLVLGLDGLDPDLLRRLCADHALDNLRRLVDDATSEPLRPGEERYTGLAWEQFSTGLDIATGGRTSGVSFDPRTYTIAQPTTRLAPFTADLGARVVAFDVPYFDLARSTARGYARWGAHDPGVPRHAEPAELGAEIEARFGAYPATPWIYGFVWPSADATARMGAELCKAVEVRTELTRWLLTERFPDWDLALTVVAELHSASEALWHGIDPGHPLHDQPSASVARDAVGALYTAVDHFVGEIEAACPHADILAFTPHGMGRNAADVPSMVLLPELLYRAETRRRAFEVPTTWRAGGRGPAPWPEPPDWSGLVLGAMARPRGRRLRRVPDAAPASGPPLDWMPAARYRAAWPAMHAFALPSFYDSRVRFNVKGREGAGRVRAGRERAHVEQLRALLAETRDLETGQPLDVDVLSPHDGTAPAAIAADADAIVRWGGPVTGFEHARHGVIGPAPWRRTGGHTGGDGRVTALGSGDVELPRELGSPATLVSWIRERVRRAD